MNFAQALPKIGENSQKPLKMSKNSSYPPVNSHKSFFSGNVQSWDRKMLQPVSAPNKRNGAKSARWGQTPHELIRAEVLKWK